MKFFCKDPEDLEFPEEMEVFEPCLSELPSDAGIQINQASLKDSLIELELLNGTQNTEQLPFLQSEFPMIPFGDLQNVGRT